MSQKHHLYYFSWFLHKTLLGSITDDFLNQVKNNENIIFLTCRGSLLPCSGNNSFSKAKCKECIFNRKHSKLYKFVSKYNITILYIDQIIDDINLQKIFDNRNYDYTVVDDIKEIKYKGVEIGYGALSSYVSWTRNKEPIIDKSFIGFFNKLLNQQVLLAEVYLKIIKNYNINKISFFNGRRADVRPFYDISKLMHIEIRNIENFRMVNAEYNTQRLEVYPNTLPQDTNYHKVRMDNTWNNSTDDLPTKIKKGKLFFEAKRSNKPIRQVKSFITHQNDGELPKGFNEENWNIVFFNSSDDEFIALGRSFENPIFKSQKEAIIYISEFFKDYSNVQIYLKIHPNLRGVKYDYHLGLYPLEKDFSNLTVIPSDSAVSTYSLLDNSNLVITFNSSISIEANFIRKPVIMLGTFYSSLDVAYFPTNLSELKDLLLNFQLPPKEEMNSVKYGYYMSNPQSYSSPIGNKPRKKKVAGLFIMHTFPYLKIWNSSVLFRIVHSFLTLSYWKKKERSIPSKGK